MFKVIGSILVAAGSFGLGLSFYLDLKKRLWNLEYMYKICMNLESEIRYGHSSIPDICFRMSGILENPYGEFFYDVYDKMQENDGTAFGNIWENECSNLYGKLPVKPEEFALFREFTVVGNSPDINLQEEAIQCQMQKLEHTVAILKNEVVKKGKMYTSLGLIGGLFIIIVLL